MSAAKKYFSKTGCPAYQIASDYMSGSPIRQDYLELVGVAFMLSARSTDRS